MTEAQTKSEHHAAGKSAYMLTFGCQMNVLDSELAMAAMREDQFAAVDSPRQADVILVNTCSVREKAEEKAYSFLGRMKVYKRKNPSLVVAVLGCMAQKDGELIFRRAPYVDIVAGTQHFTRVPEYVERVKRSGERILALGREEEVKTEKRLKVRPDSHTAFVAVMRGCDHHCTFCVVPNTRGMETSRPFEDVVRECEILVGSGASEIVLLGQNIDSYGKRLKPRRTLAELLYRVSGIEGLARLRFITSHPADLKPELFQAFRDLPNLMPYLHIPAQSGSDSILRAMRRGYTAERYFELVDAAREARPDIGLAGDTIVGFPGETEEDFQKTVELHRRVRYQNCYIFMYSHRAFTPADKANLSDDVPLEVKKRRCNELLALQRELAEEDNRKKIGQRFVVLGEGASKSNPERQQGRNPQNQVVIVDSGPETGLPNRPPVGRPHLEAEDAAPTDLRGKFYEVEITDATDAALYGRLV